MQAMPWLNRTAPLHARVHFHNTNWDSMNMYKRDGILRKDIKQAPNLESADYFLFHNQAPMLADEYHCWSEFGTGKPVYGVYLEEAPILVVYKRPDLVIGDGGSGQSEPNRRHRISSAPTSGRSSLSWPSKSVSHRPASNFSPASTGGR